MGQGCGDVSQAGTGFLVLTLRNWAELLGFSQNASLDPDGEIWFMTCGCQVGFSLAGIRSCLLDDITTGFSQRFLPLRPPFPFPSPAFSWPQLLLQLHPDP